MAEARRMAQLAIQESMLSELKQTGDELHRLSSSVSFSVVQLCSVDIFRAPAPESLPS